MAKPGSEYGSTVKISCMLIAARITFQHDVDPWPQLLPDVVDEGQQSWKEFQQQSPE